MNKKHFKTCSVIYVRTKICDKGREQIFVSGALDSEATGRLVKNKASRLRSSAFNKVNNRAKEWGNILHSSLSNGVTIL